MTRWVGNWPGEWPGIWAGSAGDQQPQTVNLSMVVQGSAFFVGALSSATTPQTVDLSMVVTGQGRMVASLSDANAVAPVASAGGSARPRRRPVAFMPVPLVIETTAHRRRRRDAEALLICGAL